METQRESRINLKRDMILDAATRAFRDEGYDCASMDHIAELAGASKRTVYNHFGSKEALFEAVVSRLFDDALALERVTWDPDRELHEQLSDFVHARIRFAEEQGALCLMRLVLGVFIKQPELVREVMRGQAEKDTALVAWLRDATSAGRLAVPDPKLAAKLFWAMTRGALFWPQLLEGPMDRSSREVLVREVVETFLARYRSASG